MKLQFYKKGIPTNIIKRMLLLIAVFIASVIFFEITTNISENVQISNMASPNLPTIDISYLGDATTELHGYVTEMDPCYMRDAIIPLDDSRNISLTVNCTDFEVDALSYEIQSLDTQRKIASNDISFNDSGDCIDATIQAENLIDKDEEYLLVITLLSGDREIYYYTRIMQSVDCHEQEIVDFAQFFHETALSDDASELATYIEPSSYVDNDNLNHVTIESNLTQINYGSFDGAQVGDSRLTITDISSNYISLTINYEMAREEGKTDEYYSCIEEYRIRYTADRMYLLAYDRTMEQLLDESSIEITDNLVNIGIRDSDVQYLSNETGSIVSFVQAGSLFEYDQSKRTVKQIFSFVDDPTDTRSTYDQHEILILNIDESGTMDYVVYGYMNSGSHEGECGINLYHYDSISDISTEQVFITSTNSFQILNANFSDLIYETADNDFYIIVNGTLLYIQLDELTTTELMTNLDDSQYAVSGSGRYFAWMEDAIMSSAIHIMDLETGESFDITASAGQLLKPLAFMDDDLIYGTLYEKDITSDSAGGTVYPMYELTIADISNGTSGIELMNYNKRNYYITDISIESFTITLNRITIDEEGNIVEAASDTIKNSAGEQNKAVPITTVSDNTKENVVILNMTAFDEDEIRGKISYDITGLVLAGDSRNITVATSTSNTQFFVYVGSKVTLATDDLIEAINEADENMGIVLDNEPEYVWKRGRKSYQNAISPITVGSSDSEASGSARALSAMLVHEGENVQVHTLLESGETPISILSRTLKDYNILDLTGSSLSQVLYYVSLGNPVYAYTGEDTAVLIVGYDASSIIVFDPIKGSNTRMGITDATEYFEGFGNVFVSYLD